MAPAPSERLLGILLSILRPEVEGSRAECPLEFGAPRTFFKLVVVAIFHIACCLIRGTCDPGARRSELQVIAGPGKPGRGPDVWKILVAAAC